MADPYYKRTPYGWCLDYLYDSPNNSLSWQEYVEKIEEWLNKRGVNYSVVHYSSMVRVHVYFSAIKKMGFKEAVELYWYSYYVLKDPSKIIKHPWGRIEVKNCVREYFIKNDLSIEEN